MTIDCYTCLANYVFSVLLHVHKTRECEQMMTNSKKTGRITIYDEAKQ